jgi:hypothetical protein
MVTTPRGGRCEHCGARLKPPKGTPRPTTRWNEQVWTPAQLHEAITLIRGDVARLPGRQFSGNPQFNRAGERLTGRTCVGDSLEKALRTVGLIERVTEYSDGYDPRCANVVRFRVVTVLAPPLRRVR